MYALLWETDSPLCYGWQRLSDNVKSGLRTVYDRRLTAFPELWNHLPPDPAETARKEAEEDGVELEKFRIEQNDLLGGRVGGNVSWHTWRAQRIFEIADRMSARAAAGYPVLIAPKGEK